MFHPSRYAGRFVLEMGIAVVFTIVLGHPKAASSAWETGVLDSNGSVGTFVEAQVDATGDMHIVYCRADTKVLRVLSRISGVWQTPEEPDASCNVNGDCAIAVDGAGVRRVSYRSGTALWYAGPEAVHAWDRGPIFSSADDVGRYLSLRNAADGELSLSCQNVTEGSLVLFTRDAGGAWSAPVTVDPGPNRGSNSDHVYRPGVGYAFSEQAVPGGTLLFADPMLRTHSWSIGQIYDNPRNGPYVSLQRLPMGNVVVCSFYHYDEISLGAVCNTFIQGLNRSLVIAPVDSIANSATDDVFIDVGVSSELDFGISYRNTRENALCCALGDSSVIVAVGNPLDPRTYVMRANLYQNAPNPFNPTTRIRYEVPLGGGKVAIRIFDVAGRLVKTLVDGHETYGQKTITWDGTNESGGHVASGVYFCRMEAPGFAKTVKVTLIR
jgi:hypothetical protein